MLHQFLSAEAIQASQKRVLFIFLGILFLGHTCTLRVSQLNVNDSEATQIKIPI